MAHERAATLTRKALLTRCFNDKGLARPWDCHHKCGLHKLQSPVVALDEGGSVGPSEALRD